MTTMIPENTAELIILGVAFWKSGYKFFILLCILSVVMFSGLDWALLREFSPSDFAVDNFFYYWIVSIFFLCMWCLFFLMHSKLTRLVAGIMLFQCLLNLAMSLNGLDIFGFEIPEFESIYLLHGTFNGMIWTVECVIAWIAATSSRSD